MSDRDWRTLERQWQSDPSDQDALHRAITARRRAGIPVPGWLLSHQELPARSFAAGVALNVSALKPDGRVEGCGQTGPAAPDGVQIPAHRSWWVQPVAPTDANLLEAVDELSRQRVPGLSLLPDLTDVGLQHLALLDHLERLDLSGCARVTTAGLKHLRGLSSLSWLNLWSCGGITQTTQFLLRELTNLSTLHLDRCAEVGDAGLEALSDLPELYVLGLGGCEAVTDAGVQAISSAPRLTSLDLRQNPNLTDAAVEALTDLPELSALNLSFCTGITPGGLQALVRCPNLSLVVLVGCGVAGEQARDALAKARPQCEVIL